MLINKAMINCTYQPINEKISTFAFLVASIACMLPQNFLWFDIIDKDVGIDFG